jgi:molybdenum cofactor cytidylyltransferase
LAPQGTRGGQTAPFFFGKTPLMNDTPILILAAGQSSRMRGTDKLAQQVDGTPLLTRIASLARSNSSCVFIALPNHAHPRHALIKGLDVSPLILPEAAEGMSGTLRAGVAALPICERFMVLLADLPDLTADDLATVLAAPKIAPSALIWRGATDSGKPGHPILFDASLRPRFALLHGDGGGESLVAPLHQHTYLVPLPGNRARCDLDTPEDWVAWHNARNL